jgi:hypothetical protein
VLCPRAGHGKQIEDVVVRIDEPLGTGTPSEDSVCLSASFAETSNFIDTESQGYVVDAFL